MSKQNERRDAAANDYVNHPNFGEQTIVPKIDFKNGYDRALTDLNQQLGLDESADLEAVVKEVVALARELSQQFFSYNGHEGHCAIDDEPLEGFEPYPCTCRAKALAPFKKG